MYSTIQYSLNYFTDCMPFDSTLQWLKWMEHTNNVLYNTNTFIGIQQQLHITFCDIFSLAVCFWLYSYSHYNGWNIWCNNMDMDIKTYNLLVYFKSLVVTLKLPEYGIWNRKIPNLISYYWYIAGYISNIDIHTNTLVQSLFRLHSFV